MRRATQQTKLVETSSYLVGLAVPHLRDAHPDAASTCEEYSRGEALACDFTGIMAQLNHQGVHARVGQVVGYRPGDHIEVLIELPASASVPSVLGKNGLMNGWYADLSLGHRYSHDTETGVVVKSALEVSLCREGARDGSHITEFFPSQRLLHCQNTDSLATFARRWEYPAPPPVAGDVDSTPALRQYVDDVLWPLVRERRQGLLKETGYIAASKAHRTSRVMSTIETVKTDAAPIETPPAAVVVSAVPEPTLEEKTLEYIAKLESQCKALQEAEVKASADRAREENERRIVQFKTAIDMAIGNMDGLSDATRAELKALHHSTIEAAKNASIAEQEAARDKSLGDLVLCSKALNEGKAAARIGNKFGDALYARIMATSATQEMMAAKNPQFELPAEPPAKASKVEGEVAASRHTVATVVEQEEITTSKPGWAGAAFRASLACQAGEASVNVPSYADLARGGYKAITAGVTRRSRDRNGNPIQIVEREYALRYDTPAPLGLKELAPVFHADLIDGLRFDGLFENGVKVRALPYTSTVHDSAINVAKTIESSWNQAPSQGFRLNGSMSTH